MVTEVLCLCTGKAEQTSQTQYLAVLHCLDLHYISAKLSSVIIATKLLAAGLHMPINPGPSCELLLWEMTWTAIKLTLNMVINVQ